MSYHRLDIHAHFLPDFYRDALLQAGKAHPDGMPAIPAWNIEMALKLMDRLRIAAAILSISSPGVHFGDDRAATRLARRLNEVGNDIRKQHPDRFGFFAVMPLPNIELAIAEAAYALDQLDADGVIVESNHAGIYHGDPRFDPFYAELNYRKAAMFIHPTSPCCGEYSVLSFGYPAPMIEFMFDTTRAVARLILSGVTQRFPDIRIIVPHAGAALPILAGRIESFTDIIEKTHHISVRQELRKLYYDLAGSPLPEQMASLGTIADHDHIFYGSDWPFTPDAEVEKLCEHLDSFALFTDSQRRAYMFENALRIFPRFRNTGTHWP